MLLIDVLPLKSVCYKDKTESFMCDIPSWLSFLSSWKEKSSAWPMSRLAIKVFHHNTLPGLGFG